MPSRYETEMQRVLFRRQGGPLTVADLKTLHGAWELDKAEKELNCRRALAQQIEVRTMHSIFAQYKTKDAEWRRKHSEAMKEYWRKKKAEQRSE